MKKNELTHIIKQLVSEEIRKQLPIALSEAISEVIGQKSQITEQRQAPKLGKKQSNEDLESDFRISMREIFDGEDPIRPPQHMSDQTRVEKRFSSDPKINAILNETRPFSAQQRNGMSGGMAAMADASRYQSESRPDMGALEGGESIVENHIPLSEIPEGVSVMDVAQHAPPAVANALTRNYSQMMKLIDKKKGKTT